MLPLIKVVEKEEIMKRIFVRSGMSPLEYYDVDYLLTHNVFGTNVGNFMYVYGVLNAICEEGFEIKSNYYKYDIDIDEINETCDCFIIPLADALRENFMGELKKITKVVKKLKIPCVVTSIGLRAPADFDPASGMPFDNDVKAFVNAVLEKSGCIGVRGKITGDYLGFLGYKEGEDYMAVGCSSMYSFGNRLKIRDLELKEDSLVAVNSNPSLPDDGQKFIYDSMNMFNNKVFIGQVTQELKLSYVGAPYTAPKSEYYPVRTILDPLYREGRTRFFTNIPEWLKYYREEVDFAFGCRLHGNIVGTLAGCPTLLITKDARTRELAEFHQLTSVPFDKLGDANIMDLIEKADFHSPETVQQENLDNFIKFLDINGLTHVYADGDFSKETPLEIAMKDVKTVPPVKPLTQCTYEEKAERLQKYYKAEEKHIKRLKKKANSPANKLADKSGSKFNDGSNKYVSKLKGLFNM